MKALAGALYAADSELSSSKMRSWMCGGGGGGGGRWCVCVRGKSVKTDSMDKLD